MDSNHVAATAAAVGSIVGASASMLTAWISQRTQTARARREAMLREREALYAEFVTEASRLAADALSHSLDCPQELAKLFGILGRIRLVAADSVLAAGEACCREIIDLYLGPNLTVEQIRTAIQEEQFNAFNEFTAAARAELLEIAAGHKSRFSI